jgi:hypothetical protein
VLLPKKLEIRKKEEANFKDGICGNDMFHCFWAVREYVYNLDALDKLL